MGQTLAKLVVALALVAMVMHLHGCGCNKESAAKCSVNDCVTCTTAMMLSQTTGCEKCCTDYSKCLNDASCCDFEDGGVKIKDSVNTFCGTTAKGTNSCR